MKVKFVQLQVVVQAKLFQQLLDVMAPVQAARFLGAIFVSEAVKVRIAKS